MEHQKIEVFYDYNNVVAGYASLQSIESNEEFLLHTVEPYDLLSSNFHGNYGILTASQRQYIIDRFERQEFEPAGVYRVRLRKPKFPLAQRVHCFVTCLTFTIVWNCWQMLLYWAGTALIPMCQILTDLFIGFVATSFSANENITWNVLVLDSYTNYPVTEETFVRTENVYENRTYCVQGSICMHVF